MAMLSSGAIMEGIAASGLTGSVVSWMLSDEEGKGLDFIGDKVAGMTGFVASVWASDTEEGFLGTLATGYTGYEAGQLANDQVDGPIASLGAAAGAGYAAGEALDLAKDMIGDYTPLSGDQASIAAYALGIGGVSAADHFIGGDEEVDPVGPDGDTADAEVDPTGMAGEMQALSGDTGSVFSLGNVVMALVGVALLVGLGSKLMDMLSGSDIPERAGFETAALPETTGPSGAPPSMTV